MKLSNLFVTKSLNYNSLKGQYCTFCLLRTVLVHTYIQVKNSVMGAASGYQICTKRQLCQQICTRQICLSPRFRSVQICRHSVLKRQRTLSEHGFVGRVEQEDASARAPAERLEPLEADRES